MANLAGLKKSTNLAGLKKTNFGGLKKADNFSGLQKTDGGYDIIEDIKTLPGEAAKGLAEGAVGVVGSVGSMMRMAGETSPAGLILRKLGYEVPNITLGKMIESSSQALNQKIEGLGGQKDLKWKEKPISRGSKAITNAIPSLVAAVATSGVSKMAGASSALATWIGAGTLGSLEGASARSQAIEGGASEPTANLIGLANAASSTILEKWPLDFIMDGKAGKKLLKGIARKTLGATGKKATKASVSAIKAGAKGIIAPVAEGTEEVLQGLSGNALAKVYDKTRGMLDGLSDAFVGGVGSGAAVNTAMMFKKKSQRSRIVNEMKKAGLDDNEIKEIESQVAQAQEGAKRQEAYLAEGYANYAEHARSEGETVLSYDHFKEEIAKTLKVVASKEMQDALIGKTPNINSDVDLETVAMKIKGVSDSSVITNYVKDDKGNIVPEEQLLSNPTVTELTAEKITQLTEQAKPILANLGIDYEMGLLPEIDSLILHEMSDKTDEQMEPTLRQFFADMEDYLIWRGGDVYDANTELWVGAEKKLMTIPQVTQWLMDNNKHPDEMIVTASRSNIAPTNDIVNNARDAIQREFKRAGKEQMFKDMRQARFNELEQVKLGKVAEQVRIQVESEFDRERTVDNYEDFEKFRREDGVMPRLSPMRSWDVASMNKMRRTVEKYPLQKIPVIVIKGNQEQIENVDPSKIFGMAVGKSRDKIYVSWDVMKQYWDAYTKGANFWNNKGLVPLPKGLTKDEFIRFAVEHERVHLATGLDGGMVDENLATVIALERIGRPDLAHDVLGQVPYGLGKAQQEYIVDVLVEEGNLDKKLVSQYGQPAMKSDWAKSRRTGDETLDRKIEIIRKSNDSRAAAQIEKMKESVGLDRYEADEAADNSTWEVTPENMEMADYLLEKKRQATRGAKLGATEADMKLTAESDANRLFNDYEELFNTTETADQYNELYQALISEVRDLMRMYPRNVRGAISSAIRRQISLIKNQAGVISQPEITTNDKIKDLIHEVGIAGIKNPNDSAWLAQVFRDVTVNNKVLNEYEENRLDNLYRKYMLDKYKQGMFIEATPKGGETVGAEDFALSEGIADDSIENISFDEISYDEFKQMQDEIEDYLGGSPSPDTTVRATTQAHPSAESRDFALALETFLNKIHFKWAASLLREARENPFARKKQEARPLGKVSDHIFRDAITTLSFSLFNQEVTAAAYGYKTNDMVMNYLEKFISKNHKDVKGTKKRKLLKDYLALMCHAAPEVGVNEGDPTHHYWISLTGIQSAFNSKEQEQAFNKYYKKFKDIFVGGNYQYQNMRPEKAFFNLLPKELQAFVIWTKHTVENNMLRHGLGAGLWQNADMIKNIQQGFVARQAEKKEFQTGSKYRDAISNTRVPARLYDTYEEFMEASLAEELEPYDDYAISLGGYVKDIIDLLAKQRFINMMKLVHNPDTGDRLVMFASDIKKNRPADWDQFIQERGQYVKEDPAAGYLTWKGYKQIHDAPGLSDWYKNMFKTPWVPVQSADMFIDIFKTRNQNKFLRSIVGLTSAVKRFVMWHPGMFAVQISSTPAVWMNPIKSLQRVVIPMVKMNFAPVRNVLRNILPGGKTLFPVKPNAFRDVDQETLDLYLRAAGGPGMITSQMTQSLYKYHYYHEHNSKKDPGRLFMESLIGKGGLDKAVFEDVLSRVMFEYWQTIYDRIRKGKGVYGTKNAKMSNEQAAYLAGEFVKDTTGLINSRIYQDEGILYQALMFARDFNFSFFRQITGALSLIPGVAGNITARHHGGKLGLLNSILHGDKTPEQLKALSGYYVANLSKVAFWQQVVVNLLQFGLSWWDKDGKDKDMKERFALFNKGMRKLSVKTPWKDDYGKDLYIDFIFFREFPTLLKFAFDTRRTLASKLSIVFKSMVDLGSNTDFVGNPIIWEGMKPGEKMLAIAEHVYNSVTPTFLKTRFGYDNTTNGRALYTVAQAAAMQIGREEHYDDNRMRDVIAGERKAIKRAEWLNEKYKRKMDTAATATERQEIYEEMKDEVGLEEALRTRMRFMRKETPFSRMVSFRKYNKKTILKSYYDYYGEEYNPRR